MFEHLMRHRYTPTQRLLFGPYKPYYFRLGAALDGLQEQIIEVLISAVHLL
jgi:hypothetical protein